MIARLVLLGVLAASIGSAGVGHAADPVPAKEAKVATPSLESAKLLVEKFLTEELERINLGNFATQENIATVCSKELQLLTTMERARAQAYLDGFKDANGDSQQIGKPIFADAGFFVNCQPEGVMSVKADFPETRGQKAVVLARFTSVIGDKTYAQGQQQMVLVVEDGQWRIDDVEPPRGEVDFTLRELLLRPKYMETPELKSAAEGSGGDADANK